MGSKIHHHCSLEEAIYDCSLHQSQETISSHDSLGHVLPLWISSLIRYLKISGARGAHPVLTTHVDAARNDPEWIKSICWRLRAG